MTGLGLGAKARSRSTTTIKLEDLPKYLQFNKDILTGYRRPMTSKECVYSWTYLHNESFNCYSHCFILLYALYCIQDYKSIWPAGNNPSTSAAVKWLITSDLICTMLPFMLSTCYHTFMPHVSGEHTYKRLLKLDIFGVWCTLTFGPLPNFYTGLYCTPSLLCAFLLIYMSFSAYVVFYLMVVDCKQKRTTVLIAQFAFRFLIHPIRLSSMSHSSTSSVYYHMTVDLIAGASALINALHVPERWFPGKFDYAFNSHALMHVMTMVCFTLQRPAFLLDMQWLNDLGTCPRVVHDLSLSGISDIGMGLIHSIGFT